MAVQIVIILTDDNQVTVNGPIDNKVMMFGLLECAKEAVSNYHRNNQRKVQPAAFIPKAVSS